MSKLPMGNRNVHIQQSLGADTNIMKFYITQNSTTYGARFENFKPRQDYHRGTGYLSNFRPSVYYNRRLDDVDNPAMRRICDGNYRSVTQLDFQPYRDSSGLEAFPINVIQTSTGFGKGKSAVIPVDFQGPQKMKSETHEKFQGRMWPDVTMGSKEVGPQEMSGFVRNGAEDPITFEPQKAHENLKPGWCTHRPTGVSISKTSYIPKTWSRGDDRLPGGIPRGSERGTGFTREEVKPKYVNIKAPDAYDRLNDMPEMKAERTRKQDPAEYINMQNPHNKSSLQHEQFKGAMRCPPIEAERLNTSVGFQEDSGYVRNNAPYLQHTDDKMRFMTHHMSRFGLDPTPIGAERAGHLRGGIQEMRPNGFTKSVGMNDFGSEAPSTQVLHRIEPYVGRSLTARNVYFDDHTYDTKLHTQLIA
ncbi:unnamed protein product [Candidula unifasciata]|uniref:Protein phosphatase 1 regulatory subunit 32 n=1 Tax=Candidula unifasciata TaxID=100452 RepID=A0A8S3ZHD6_9EUPU|nr:unnamed protein product [Candidula unifasciata]